MNKAESSGGNASQVQMEPVENQIIVYQPNETVRLDVRLAKRGRGVKIELADLRSQNVTSKVDVKEAA